MIPESVFRLGNPLFTTIHFIIAISATSHVVLHKRNVRATIGWIGLIWLSPLIGAVLYLLLGINRIQRTGTSLGLSSAWNAGAGHGVLGIVAFSKTELALHHPGMNGMDTLAERVSGKLLSAGNSAKLLLDGDEAFPAMLDAIGQAKHSITLISYIFDNDEVGNLFLSALQQAKARGVQVRVLIDSFGALYSRSRMSNRFETVGIPVASFLSGKVPKFFRYANLRNHRKIMVVDGILGFTGGINIRVGHWLSRQPKSPVRCLHFSLRGPIVRDLQRTFATDWAFATQEQLSGTPWFFPLGTEGPVLSRGISDGPDTDLDNMLKIMLGALSSARKRVRILSPYFLPDEALLYAIKCSALRGVQVDIIIPSRSNFAVMDWAMRPQLSELIENGCCVHFSPPPFDHAKLFTVDGVWSLIGSTNWDARSLRLNFEYNVECYDTTLAESLDALAEGRIAQAHHVTLNELNAFSLPVRLRNGLARLLAPYI